MALATHLVLLYAAGMLSSLPFLPTSCFVLFFSLPALAVKNLPANTGDIRDMGSIPWAGKIPWRWARQPCPVFFPGEYQGQRNLVGCGP